MNRPRLHLLPLIAALGLTHCTVARNVRPVGAGKGAFGLSVGGPFFTNLGPPVPVPLLAAYGRYGLTDSTDLDVGLHLPVVRATGLDVGVAHLFLDQDGGIPAVMAGLRVAVMGNGRALLRDTDPNTGQPYALEPRIFEEIYGTASWQLRDWLLYAGLSVFAQLEDGLARPSLYAGTQWRAKDWLGINLEAKWMAFLTDQSHMAVSWHGVDGIGAFGLQLGAVYYFTSGGPL